MKSRSFTLIELIVVIIIVGILAAVGLTQYGKTVEKSRKAEATTVMGDIRKLATAYCLEKGSVTSITDADLNIGTNVDQIPYSCRSTHYFYYRAGALDSSRMWIEAFRCTSGGKTPPYSGPYYLYEMVCDVCGGTTFQWDCGTFWGNGNPCP